MSEQTTTAALTGDAKTLAVTLASMLDTAAAKHRTTADDKRHPAYSEATPIEEAEAAAFDVMADGFSSLAHDIRTEFGLDTPNPWAAMFGQKS